DVAAQQLDLAVPEHEVVRGGLLVPEEEVLDLLGAVAEAEHELLVTPVRVVAHHVPDQRSRADELHRLGHVPGSAGAHPRAEPAAEEDDLHTTSNSGMGKTSRPPQSRT